MLFLKMFVFPSIPQVLVILAGTRDFEELGISREFSEAERHPGAKNH
jgi:hypothetical protein